MAVIDLHPYKPIGCADYEYIEIACMDRNIVDVITDTGTEHGLALTTQTNPRGEFLIIEQTDGEQKSVRVDRIRKIIVRSAKRRFEERVFQR